MATYTIDSVQDLEDLASKTGKFSGITYSGNTFVLTTDLDIGDSNPGDSGEGWVPIGPSFVNKFDGVFDGQNHTISNLTINRPTDDYQGLFGYLSGADSSIKNLILHNVTITGNDSIGCIVSTGHYCGSIINCRCTGTIILTGAGNIGGIIGKRYGGVDGFEIKDCCIEGTISITATSNYVGGIVGSLTNLSYSSSISGCYVNGTLTINSDGGYVGGIGGNIEDCSLTSCYVNGTINISGKDDYIGGLVGRKTRSDLSVTSCYAAGSGTIEGDTSSYFVGGLMGYTTGDITSCYCTLNVSSTAPYYTGGLVGKSLTGIISNCYATGTVSGDNSVGGLIGECNDNAVSNCYSTGDVSADSVGGGLIGFVDSNSVITNCYATGAISGEDLGGFIGGNNGGNISNCYSTGDVDANDTAGGFARNNDGNISNCYSTGVVKSTKGEVGGFVGYNSGYISSCYSTGDASGDDRIGGFAGHSYGSGVGDEAVFEDCYAEGNVTGDQMIGGFVGELESHSVVKYCYSVGSVSGNGSVGGFAGLASSTNVSGEYCYWDAQASGQEHSAAEKENEIEGKTTAQMKKQKTFVNWDFVDVWGIVESALYPKLRDLYVFPKQHYLFSLNLDQD